LHVCRTHGTHAYATDKRKALLAHAFSAFNQSLPLRTRNTLPSPRLYLTPSPLPPRLTPASLTPLFCLPLHLLFLRAARITSAVASLNCSLPLASHAALLTTLSFPRAREHKQTDLKWSTCSHLSVPWDNQYGAPGAVVWYRAAFSRLFARTTAGPPASGPPSALILTHGTVPAAPPASASRTTPQYPHSAHAIPHRHLAPPPHLARTASCLYCLSSHFYATTRYMTA